MNTCYRRQTSDLHIPPLPRPSPLRPTLPLSAPPRPAILCRDCAEHLPLSALLIARPYESLHGHLDSKLFHILVFFSYIYHNFFSWVFQQICQIPSKILPPPPPKYTETILNGLPTPCFPCGTSSPTVTLPSSHQHYLFLKATFLCLKQFLVSHSRINSSFGWITFSSSVLR